MKRLAELNPFMTYLLLAMSDARYGEGQGALLFLAGAAHLHARLVYGPNGGDTDLDDALTDWAVSLGRRMELIERLKPRCYRLTDKGWRLAVQIRASLGLITLDEEGSE